MYLRAATDCDKHPLPRSQACTCIDFCLPAPRRADTVLWFSSIDGRSEIRVDANDGDEDVAGVALMQALLSWALPREFPDGLPPVDICIQGIAIREEEYGLFTKAGLDLQLAPLLPLIAKHPSWQLKTGIWGKAPRLMQTMQVG
jgi:hypothetical protein